MTVGNGGRIAFDLGAYRARLRESVGEEDYSVYLWEEALLEESRVPAAHRRYRGIGEMRAFSEYCYRTLVPPEIPVSAPTLDMGGDARTRTSFYDEGDHRILLGHPTPVHIAHETAHAAIAALGRIGLDEYPLGHGPAFCGAAALLWERLGWQPRETIERMARVCHVGIAPWSAVLEDALGEIAEHIAGAPYWGGQGDRVE